MIYLTTNTANQTVFLSLDEARQYYATAFSHYLIIITHEENSTTGEELAQVATIVLENVRITQLTVTTVGLTLAGRYRYVVYGQNSSSNINPTNGSVVGVVQRGYVVLTDNEQFLQIEIARAMAVSSNNYIINGTGSSQPYGLVTRVTNFCIGSSPSIRTPLPNNNKCCWIFFGALNGKT